MSRRLLHYTKIDEFKAWLTTKSIEHREGQGDGQVMQVKQNNLWLAIYERFEIKSDYTVKQKPHLTNDKRLDRLVSEFCKENKK